MLFNILKIKPIFGDFVIRYRFSMLFHAGLSIVRYWFWVHIRCKFDILKYHAALHCRMINLGRKLKIDLNYMICFHMQL